MSKKTNFFTGKQITFIFVQILRNRQGWYFIIVTLAALAGHGHIDDAFDYELCQFPPALAESPDFLHEPQKANFADALWTSVSNKEVAIPKQAKYVIDGGVLLHSIPSTRGATFSSILNSHTQYVLKKYGKAIIVFDG